MQKEQNLNSERCNGELLVVLAFNATVLCTEATLSASTHLHGDVPGQVDVGFVLVHPDLGHPQSVAPRVEGYVVVVRFLRPCYVSHPGAGQHLHAAAAHPHLQDSEGEEKEVEEKAGRSLFFPIRNLPV